MPIIIEKGSGENDLKKSNPHPIVRESDMVYISPPNDLKELLHLKLFHISHKKKSNSNTNNNNNLNNNKIQKRLIGEQYYNLGNQMNVVKKAKAKDVLNVDSESNNYGHIKLTNLLRKIRKLKVKKFSEQGYQKVCTLFIFEPFDDSFILSFIRYYRKY